jgi:hypothetical protein
MDTIVALCDVVYLLMKNLSRISYIKRILNSFKNLKLVIGRVRYYILGG